MAGVVAERAGTCSVRGRRDTRQFVRHAAARCRPNPDVSRSQACLFRITSNHPICLAHCGRDMLVAVADPGNRTLRYSEDVQCEMVRLVLLTVQWSGFVGTVRQNYYPDASRVQNFYETVSKLSANVHFARFLLIFFTMSVSTRHCQCTLTLRTRHMASAVITSDGKASSLF